MADDRLLSADLLAFLQTVEETHPSEGIQAEAVELHERIMRHHKPVEKKPRVLRGEDLIISAYELGFHRPGKTLAQALEAHRRANRAQRES